MQETERTTYGEKPIRTLSSTEVIKHYLEGNISPRDDVLKMIQLYPDWQIRDYGWRQIGQLVWLFNRNDPRHISSMLTENGKHRRVVEVAKMYRTQGEEIQQRWPEEVDKIQSMIKALESKNGLSRMIIVEGCRYPNSPDSSFIDGIHRSLATVLYGLTINPQYKCEVLVGRKASLMKRVLNLV